MSEPKCPECGSERIWRKGKLKRICKNCGRYFGTLYRPKLGVQSLPGADRRPLCVDCGAPFPVSEGAAWHCTSCGRYWCKFPRRSFSQIESEVEIG